MRRQPLPAVAARRVAAALAAAAFALALGAAAGAAWGQAADPQAIRVSTARQLVRALGPRRTVLLEPGTYELAEAQGATTDYAYWEEVFDGQQLVLHDLNGLTLRADAQRGTTILVEPRYAYVLALVGCRGIAIENLTLGHTVAGYCVGGVVLLERCEEVRLQGCDLYGSGTVGIDIVSCTGVEVSESTIRDCTYGAVSISDSSDVVFSAVELVDNEAWPLIGVYASSDVLLEDCWIGGNTGDSLFAIDPLCGEVALPGTYIDDNDTDLLASEDGLLPDLSEAVVGDNLFDAQGGEYYEEGEYDGEYDEEYGEGYGEDYLEEGQQSDPGPGDGQ